MPHVPIAHDRPLVPSSDPGGLAPTLGRLSRRRVVQAGMAIGATTLLGAALPGSAVAAATRRRLVVPRSALTPGRTTGPLRAPHRFDLLGAPVSALAGAGLQVRARTRGGRWGSWHALSAHDGHAPDGRRAAMCEPVWFGDADEVELRARRRPARDVRLELVAVPSATKRGAARASARAAAAGGIPLQAASARVSGGAPAGRRAAPTIIPRAAWASGLTPRDTPSMGQVQLAFVHHTVNGNEYSREQSAGIVRAICEYHMRSNGWSDIGYNFLVDRFGQVFEGRAGGVDQPVIGAQAIGWNSVSTGIAIIGTFQDAPAPEAALAAVASIIGWKLPLHGVPTAGTVALVSSGGAGNRWKSGTNVAFERISGHQDGCSTDCPGRALYGQLGAVRSRVGNVQPGAVTALTIEAPTDAAAYAATVTVGGRLATGGAGVGGTAVVVDKRSPSGAWVPVAQATTDVDGHWSAGFVLRSATPVRARAAGHTSRSVTPALDPRLVLHQPPRHPRTGRTMLVRGRAKGVREVKIVLRRKVGGRYVPVTSRTVRVSKGAFRGRLPVRRSGVHQVGAQVRSGNRTFRSTTRLARARG